MCASSYTHTPLTDDEFATLLLANAPLIHHLARRAAVLGHDADDIAQEVFLLAWRRRARYDPTRPTKTGKPPFAMFVVWAWRNVLSVLGPLNSRGNRKRRAVPADPQGPVMLGIHRGERDEPARSLEEAEIVERVQATVNRLDGVKRAAVVGRMAGVKYSDLFPGESRQCAEQRFKAGLRDMRAELAEAFGE